MPREFNGNPSPSGKDVFPSVGPSNTTQEFQAFMPLAAANSSVNHTCLKLVDGAAGGQTADLWDSPTDANYDRVRDQELAPLGLSESQVAVAWVKVAHSHPSISLPNANADANTLAQQMGGIARSLKIRYPNIQQVYFSSRIYAGYATSLLNPEPYAYESGFSVKRVVGAQIAQEDGQGVDSLVGDLDDDTTAPWLAWGPYLWADGLNARSDGLTWLSTDFSSTDGSHPSINGRTKVANMMMDFFLNSPQTQTWFTVPEPSSVGVLAIAAAGAIIPRRRGRADTRV